MAFEAFILNILIFIGIYIILGVSLNLVLGFTGLINLGHIALFGIGSYVSALFVKLGYPFLFSFLSAGIVAGFFAFILIYATRNLKGDYFALATLGFGFVVYSLMLNLQTITRGPLGIAGITKPKIFNFILSNNLRYFVFTYIIVIITVIIINSIVKSPFGKLLHAARNDELGLRVLGKNTNKIKYKAMIVSGFFAGISGSLFAHYVSFIEPSSFYISEIILILSIVIIGGIASIQGTIASTILLFMIPEILRFFDLPVGILGASRQIIYAIILIGILIYKPRGLFGKIDLE